MKKIYTLFMLSMFAVINVNATEETLWEGDWNVSWDLPDGDPNREWKELGKDDFAAMEAGQKLYFYLTVVASADYHKYNFDDWGWAPLPGHEAEHASDFGFSADTKVEFILTQEIKDAIAAGGFAMHGHGYHVTKVTKETDEEQPTVTEEDLWTGDWNVSWELPDGDVNREWKELGQDDFAAMEAGQVLYFYLTVVASAEYHKYNFDDWGWAPLPGHEAEHASDFGFSADSKVEFILTQEIKDAIAAGGFAMHGHGYHVVKVSKKVESTPTGITSPSVERNEMSAPVAYNLSGQRVQNPTRGLYIINGKKVILK